MSIAVTFEIIAKRDINMETIATRLTNLDLKVLPYTIEDVGKKAHNPKSIMCTFYFPETEAVGLTVAQTSMLKNIDGVEDAKMVHSRYQRDKRSWYDHFMIPLLISTAVYSLVVLGVLLGLSREFGLTLDWMTYLLYLVIPAISSFCAGVGYIRYRQII
jgi:hypothetical protein